MLATAENSLEREEGHIEETSLTKEQKLDQANQALEEGQESRIKEAMKAQPDIRIFDEVGFDLFDSDEEQIKEEIKLVSNTEPEHRLPTD